MADDPTLNETLVQCLKTHQFDSGALMYDDIRACNCGELLGKGSHFEHVVQELGPLVQQRVEAEKRAFFERASDGDGHIARIAELELAVREANAERDRAIEHDRQPYPTQWAYDQACAALHAHQERAEELELLITSIHALADRWEYGAQRWEDPLPVDRCTDQLRAILNAAPSKKGTP